MTNQSSWEDNTFKEMEIPYFPKFPNRLSMAICVEDNQSLNNLKHLPIGPAVDKEYRGDDCSEYLTDAQNNSRLPLLGDTSKIDDPLFHNLYKKNILRAY